MHYRKISAILAVGGLCLAQNANAVSYLDTSFDLANYQIQTTTVAGPLVTVAQSQSAGNPGQAIVVDTSVAAGGSFNSNNYILNTAFSYNPFQSGVISSLTLSQDIWISLTGISLGIPSANFIIAQAGSLYATFVPLSGVQSVYQVGAQTFTNPNAFSRVTNLSTLALDTSSHPSFSAGIMQFGVLPGLNFSGNHAAAIEQVRIDNFSINISAIPEPASSWLSLLGIASLALIFYTRSKSIPRQLSERCSLTLCSSRPAPAKRNWASFHSGPIALRRRGRLNSTLCLGLRHSKFAFRSPALRTYARVEHYAFAELLCLARTGRC